MNLVAARFTPISRKLRYPMTTQANEKSPNEVSPQNATSLGIARTKTTNVQPSVTKFRTALRASNDDGASSRVGGFGMSACKGCSIVVGNFGFLNSLMVSVGMIGSSF